VKQLVNKSIIKKKNYFFSSHNIITAVSMIIEHMVSELSACKI